MNKRPMGRRRKRKLKKKIKKFSIIFSIILITIISIIIYNNKTNLNNVNKNNESKKINDLDKINKQCNKIEYCNKKYINRYVNYYKKNKNLNIEDVITRVNINLDYDFYTHTKKTPYLNKSYILVNKYLYLGGNYTPNNLQVIPEEYARSGMRLVKEAKEAFVSMARKAKRDDSPIIAMSSYRSYDYQVDLYNKYKESDGVEAADSYSARAGYSEHQTGLCVLILIKVILLNGCKIMLINMDLY